MPIFKWDIFGDFYTFWIEIYRNVIDSRNLKMNIETVSCKKIEAKYLWQTWRLTKKTPEKSEEYLVLGIFPLNHFHLILHF